ncbi:MAG: hypothetical protein ACTHKJ_08005 [Candidatus Nitrosocosmicus sp.]
MKNNINSNNNSNKFKMALLCTIFGIALVTSSLTFNPALFAQSNNTSMSQSFNQNQTSLKSNSLIKIPPPCPPNCPPPPPPCPPNCPPPKCTQSDIRICPPPGGFTRSPY